MSEGSAATAGQLARGVQAALEGLAGDYGRMPFFVRPMARRGLAGRTGLGLDEWRGLVQALGADLEAGASAAEVQRRHPGVRERLARLAEDFRGAPERARRGMGQVPPHLEQAAREREQAVRALLAWLG